MESPFSQLGYLKLKRSGIMSKATTIEQLLFTLRQKIKVARNAKQMNQLGLYKYSIESSEKILKELMELIS